MVSKRSKNKDKKDARFVKFYNNEIRLTDKQKLAEQIVSDNKFTFISGCWGTAKTFTACHIAYSLLSSGKYDKVIITKPIVEAGENIGFLKGDLSDKVAPYAESYYDTFAKISDATFVEELKSTGELRFAPIAYMRGNNFEKSIIIVDEAQNLSEKQLMLVMTRFVEGSKMIIIGDKNQTDIPNKQSGFTTLKEILEGVEGIGYFEFGVEDIMRDKTLIEITKRYEQWKSLSLDTEKPRRIYG